MNLKNRLAKVEEQQEAASATNATMLAAQIRNLEEAQSHLAYVWKISRTISPLNDYDVEYLETMKTYLSAVEYGISYMLAERGVATEAPSFDGIHKPSHHQAILESCGRCMRPDAKEDNHDKCAVSMEMFGAMSASKRSVLRDALCVAKADGGELTELEERIASGKL